MITDRPMATNGFVKQCILDEIRARGEFISGGRVVVARPAKIEEHVGWTYTWWPPFIWRRTMYMGLHVTTTSLRLQDNCIFIGVHDLFDISMATGLGRRIECRITENADWDGHVQYEYIPVLGPVYKEVEE